jgi:hypothetical protein
MKPVGLAVLAQPLVDQRERARRQLHGVRMIFKPRRVGDMKQADKVDRVALEDHVIGDIDPLIVDNEILCAFDGAAAAGDGLKNPVQARDIFRLLLLQRRAENPRQISNFFGDQKIVLHEALNRRQTRLRAVAEARGDFALDVEGQALLRFADRKMHVAAHGPEKVLCLQKLPVLIL